MHPFFDLVPIRAARRRFLARDSDNVADPRQRSRRGSERDLSFECLACMEYLRSRLYVQVDRPSLERFSLLIRRSLPRCLILRRFEVYVRRPLPVNAGTRNSERHSFPRSHLPEPDTWPARAHFPRTPFQDRKRTYQQRRLLAHMDCFQVSDQPSWQAMNSSMGKGVNGG